MQGLNWLEWIIPMMITVLTGVLVFLVGEFIRTKWSEPTARYVMLRSKISSALSYYANRYTSPVFLNEQSSLLPEVYKIASDEFRQLACELRGFIEQKPIFLSNIPTKKILYEASSYLIGLSNGLIKADANDSYTAKDNRSHAKHIKDLLSIYDGDLS